MHNQKLPPDAEPTIYGHNTPYGAYGQAPGYVPQPPVPPKKTGTKILLITALIVLLLGAVALFVLFVLPSMTGTSSFLGGEEFEITVASSNPSYGSVEGSGVYDENERVEISAIPKDGCIFYQWSDGSTEATRKVKVREDSTYTAIFYGPLSDWSNTCPEGTYIEEEETWYQVSSNELVSSNPIAPAGYILTDSYWELADSDQIVEVDSWPTGFDTSHPLYKAYPSGSVSEMETDTKRVEVTEDGTGYIYWHWCRGTRVKGAINRTATREPSGEFCAFHAYYSTREPLASGSYIEATYHENSDSDNPNPSGAYHQPNNACCTDSFWFYPLEVTSKTVNTYEKVFVYADQSDLQQGKPTSGSYTEITRYRYRPQ